MQKVKKSKKKDERHADKRRTESENNVDLKYFSGSHRTEGTIGRYRTGT